MHVDLPCAYLWLLMRRAMGTGCGWRSRVPVVADARCNGHRLRAVQQGTCCWAA